MKSRVGRWMPVAGATLVVALVIAGFFAFRAWSGVDSESAPQVSQGSEEANVAPAPETGTEAVASEASTESTPDMNAEQTSPEVPVGSTPDMTDQGTAPEISQGTEESSVAPAESEFGLGPQDIGPGVEPGAQPVEAAPEAGSLETNIVNSDFGVPQAESMPAPDLEFEEAAPEVAPSSTEDSATPTEATPLPDPALIEEEGY